MLGYKICPKCKQQKEHVEFYIDVSRKDKMSVYCKSCKRDYVNRVYRSRKHVETEDLSEWGKRAEIMANEWEECVGKIIREFERNRNFGG